jgi:hypothetical protein
MMTVSSKEFLPPVAGSDEFTSAADTDFRNGDALIAYFELCEPTLGQPHQTSNVKYTIRIENEQTGAVATEGVQIADSWTQSGFWACDLNHCHRNSSVRCLQ